MLYRWLAMPKEMMMTADVEAVAAAGATHAEGMRDEWCDEDYHTFSCPSLPPARNSAVQ